MKNTHLIFLLLAPFCIGANPVLENYFELDNQERARYIERYRYVAVEEMERAGIPASIKLAQGILESADGKSVLATKANNHFGVKCGSRWTGKTYYRKDDDYDDKGRLIESCFRVYKNAEASYRAHSDFLTDPRKKYRYGFLFDIPVTDYKAWAKGLKKAGYATNPKYAELLIGIVEANQLNQYDFMTVVDMELKFKDDLKRESILYNNDVKMVYAEEGQKLSAIASKYELKLSRLVEYNDLKSADVVLSKGDRVYLQRKRKSYRGRPSFHVVKSGETMYAIAQRYGVRLEKLYKKNRLFAGTEPAVGERISLRKKVKKNAIPRLKSQSSDNVPSFTMPLKTFVADLFADVSDPEEKTGIEEENPRPVNTYTVEKGDTLYSISRRFDISVSELKALNKLGDNTISIGQVLKLN